MTTNSRKRKVALFACHDLVGLLMLNGIVPAMKAMGLEPVLFNTRTARNKAFRVPTPPLVAMMNVGALESVILPFMEGKNGPTLTYRQLAQKYGFAYHEIDDVNDPAFVRQITDDAEIIGGLSVRFLQVFGQEIIAAFRAKGFLWNLHSGLLGAYKGLLLPYRAIQNGEKEYGLTLHETAAGIDEGGIIAKGALPLDATRPVMDLYLDTVETAVRLVAEAFGKLCRSGTIETVPQDKGGRYYSNPTAREFADFMEKGVFYIDPAQTIPRIASAFAGEGTKDSATLSSALHAFMGAAEEAESARRTVGAA